MTSLSKTLILIAGTAALAGCKTSAPDMLPPQSADVNTGMDGMNGMGANGSGMDSFDPASTPGTQEHFEREVRGQNTIYFDTDRFNIDSTDAASLQQQARYLSQFRNVDITIEGHCDERGTREYNLALGERRANAAKNYLVSLGVDASRISTVSYGKERPVETGSNARAWEQNRRAVSVVIS